MHRRLLALAVCAAATLPGWGADSSADPAGLLQSALRALRGNDLAAWHTGLPEAQRTAFASALASTRPSAPAPADNGGMGGNGGGRNRLRGPNPPLALALLAQPEFEPQLGRLFAATLAAAAAWASPAGTVPAGPQTQTGEHPLQAMLPRLAAAQLVAAGPQAFLASGLETRQITAWQGLLAAGSLCAATARLDDPALAAKAQPHLAAAVKALPRPDGDQGLEALLAGWSHALPPLKAALAVYGMDVDATLDGASVLCESEGDDQAVVVVAFSAFATRHALPLRLRRETGAWLVVADSPALRWLRSGQPGVGGARFGGPPPGPAGGPTRWRRPDAAQPAEDDKAKPGQAQF